MTADHRTGSRTRLAFFAAGVLFSFLMLGESATTYVPGPRVELQRSITELVFGALALLSFWFAYAGITKRFSLIAATLVAVAGVVLLLMQLFG